MDVEMIDDDIFFNVKDRWLIIPLIAIFYKSLVKILLKVDNWNYSTVMVPWLSAVIKRSSVMNRQLQPHRDLFTHCVLSILVSILLGIHCSRLVHMLYFIHTSSRNIYVDLCPSMSGALNSTYVSTTVYLSVCTSHILVSWSIT